MTAPAAGEPAPYVTLRTASGAIEIPDPAGRPVILMFYQEASTPACSTQVGALYAESELIDELGAIAICTSVDPLNRQQAFGESLGFPAALLASDEGGTAAQAYGVYDEITKRAQRAAFVVDGGGMVRLAIPWYSPSNSEQFLSIFAALGLEGDEGESNPNG